MGQLEVAREEFFRGDRPRGEAAYWGGVVASASPAARGLLRASLALVARPGELDSFPSLATSDLAGFVRRFWSRRDVESAVAPGDRLVEHYRRYEIARRGFRPVGLGMAGASLSTAYRMSQSLLLAPSPSEAVPSPAAEPEDGLDAPVVLWGESSLLLGEESQSDGFDVRGQVFMRHGPPDDMAGALWLYREGGREYMIKVNTPYPGTPCNLAAKYCRYEMAGRRAPPEVRHRWETEWAAMLAELKTFDGQASRFRQAFTPSVRLYAFPRTDQSHGQLVAAFAVPGWQLQPQPVPGGMAYQLRVHLIVGRATGESRIDLDTVRTFKVSSPLKEGDYLQALEVLPLDPGQYIARMYLTGQDSTAGALLAADSLRLDDGTHDLALSDLIFGREGAGLAWTSPDGPVSLHPLGTFRRNELMLLYYEVAGLRVGTACRTTVQIIKADGKEGRPKVSLTFEDQSDRSETQVRRSIGLRQLSPGNYIVQVTVSSGDRTTVRRAPVTITE